MFVGSWEMSTKWEGLICPCRVNQIKNIEGSGKEDEIDAAIFNACYYYLFFQEGGRVVTWIRNGRYIK